MISNEKLGLQTTRNMYNYKLIWAICQEKFQGERRSKTEGDREGKAKKEDGMLERFQARWHQRGESSNERGEVKTRFDYRRSGIGIYPPCNVQNTFSILEVGLVPLPRFLLPSRGYVAMTCTKESE